MTFTQAISSCYSNYATFSVRASRSEYWFFTLYHCLLVVTAVMLTPVGIGWVILIGGGLIDFLPSLSVLVRRLHDTDHSGWWYWICLIRFVGLILLLIWFCTRGTWGSNRFGLDPLGAKHCRHLPTHNRMRT